MTECDEHTQITGDTRRRRRLAKLERRMPWLVGWCALGWAFLVEALILHMARSCG